MRKNEAAVFSSGAMIGFLGGLIGLGGAEFRLPLLIGIFGFGALEGVILNKAMSLIVVSSALPFRLSAVPVHSLVEHWDIILNLLGGSLLGAWSGASWAVRLKAQTFYKAIALLLFCMSLLLLFGHNLADSNPVALSEINLVFAGIVSGFVIGVVASLLGVAGGELLIPTLVLLFGTDIKLAGSLSLAISLPTMLTGFLRYSSDRSFTIIGQNKEFLLIMAAGSILGTFLGAQLLRSVPETILLPMLSAILVVSAIKVWGHV
ncbi:hypothetical protein MGMO_39c00120 [Methyloglobulus morosus KoM1]|uniref:Probable membrane transporter protein n=1 Tax=Methyloglobulus morosus KoM1 TaxID=1116472 RepID=V5C8G0_9GAMM|nr:sulfite exporter TauE/SafE family protein [Methyloglobulus morosus]ESS73013.1 hypothetical protein MGMO_39c00120 [Methyloglobulus morosus KoM1]